MTNTMHRPLFNLYFLSPLLSVLIWTMTVSPQGARWACPDPCTCREDHVDKVGRAYAVLCSNKGLTRIPDLSSLVSVNISVMLKMDYCELSRVVRGDFPAGLKLAILHINGNSGVRLDPDALHNVKDTLVFVDLQAINLPFNETLHFLSGCGHLEELSLSFNNKGNGHTPRVTAGLFKDLGLVALTKLNMYNCNIRSLAENVFEGANGIVNLHLGSNLIGQVPPALNRLYSLQTLDLSSNYIEHLANGSFINLTQLRELKLHRNDIDIVDDGAFAGLQSSLVTLVMDFCSLREVPTEALRPLANLSSLDLTGNLFTSIGPDAFVGSYCLNELYVSSRTMSFDKLMFTGQRFCIKDLKIRKAELTRVPLEPISDLVKLQYLFLDKNNITRLCKDGLKGITAATISFSDNPIRTVERGAFNGLRSKVILLLERTEISDLSFIFDYPNDTFGFLSLYGSPIPCDCILHRIIQMRSENFLYGTCSHAGQGLNLKDPKLTGILDRKCRRPPKLGKPTTSSSIKSRTVEPQVQRRQKQMGNKRRQDARKKNRRKSKTSHVNASGKIQMDMVFLLPVILCSVTMVVPVW
ncbi:uncharacterized protein LOC143293993 [Babylonia areolata]|uniref:uncharacterized protein LOC143293993 n=1 Tax=Babylonia areolata TaxID=304850 RepID=UPI003FD20A92